jgi:carboxymethylenebutenolidase
MASFWEIQRVGSGELLDDMHTYVSQPDAPGRRPAVIVIQEIFGVSPHIQSIADRFASEGYFAVAPALFHRYNNSEEVRGTNPVFGYGDEDVPERNVARETVSDEGIIEDIDTTITWLKSHPRVDAENIGIVGFCFGGRVVYLTASACPGLKAGSVFYGGNIMRALGDGPSAFERTSNIQCPVLGSFGAEDQNPSPEDVSNIEAELKKHGKTYDFKVYPGAGHGFYCEERASYRKEQAEDAFARTLSWFQKHMAQVAATA